MRRRTTSQHAFTLVEVLTVVSILMILIALLLPAMHRAQYWAHVVHCQTNMRQLGLATVMYANDHKRHLPRPNSNSSDDHPWSANGGVKTGWAYRGKAYKTEGVEALEEGAYWPYTLKHETYRCPAHDPNWWDNGTQVLGSYTMNRLVINPLWTFRIDQYQSTDVMFWETDETSSWWNDLCNYPWEGLPSARHGTGGTIVCADGHTEWLTHERFYEEAPKNPKQRTMFWNSPGSANGNNSY